MVSESSQILNRAGNSVFINRRIIHCTPQPHCVKGLPVKSVIKGVGMKGHEARFDKAVAFRNLQNTNRDHVTDKTLKSKTKK